MSSPDKEQKTDEAEHPDLGQLAEEINALPTDVRDELLSSYIERTKLDAEARRESEKLRADADVRKINEEIEVSKHLRTQEERRRVMRQRWEEEDREDDRRRESYNNSFWRSSASTAAEDEYYALITGYTPMNHNSASVQIARRRMAREAARDAARREIYDQVYEMRKMAQDADTPFFGRSVKIVNKTTGNRWYEGDPPDAAMIKWGDNPNKAIISRNVLSDGTVVNRYKNPSGFEYFEAEVFDENSPYGSKLVRLSREKTRELFRKDREIKSARRKEGSPFEVILGGE